MTLRIVTPNTNVDPKFAGFSTDGATDNQVLSYDSASDSLVWADISTLDNTFEAGITVSGAQSTFSAEVEINAVLDVNDNIECDIFRQGWFDAGAGSLTHLDSNITITGQMFQQTTHYQQQLLLQVVKAVRITDTSIDIFAVPYLHAYSYRNLQVITGDVTDVTDIDDMDAENVEITNQFKLIY